MAKVHHRKARKDYPGTGIKKGDMYYFCQMKTGPRSSRTIRSLKPIPPSQLTTSEFLGTWLGEAERATGELSADDIREIAATIQELGETTREKYDAMPEGLQQGDTGQMLETRADACDEASSDLEGHADELDALEEPEEPDYGDLDEDSDEYQDLLSDHEEALSEHENAAEAILDEVRAVLDNTPE